MAYSKNKVDKAGQTLADYLRTIVDSEATAIERSPEVLQAVEIIDWWRGEHAKPPPTPLPVGCGRTGPSPNFETMSPSRKPTATGRFISLTAITVD